MWTQLFRNSLIFGRRGERRNAPFQLAGTRVPSPVAGPSKINKWNTLSKDCWNLYRQIVAVNISLYFIIDKIISKSIIFGYQKFPLTEEIHRSNNLDTFQHFIGPSAISEQKMYNFNLNITFTVMVKNLKTSAHLLHFRQIHICILSLREVKS